VDRIAGAPRARTTWVARGFLAMAVAALGLPLIALREKLGERASAFSNNCENIQELNVAAGRWLAEHVPEGRWIAASDAGAIRFFSGRPTIDLDGLNAHRVLRGELEAVLAEKPPCTT